MQFLTRHMRHTCFHAPFRWLALGCWADLHRGSCQECVLAGYLFGMHFLAAVTWAVTFIAPADTAGMPQEEYLLSSAIALAVSVLLGSLTAGNSQDYVFAGYFLICAS